MHEAYSHEVSSCGYWPGSAGEEGCSTLRLSRAARLPEHRSSPAGARWDDDLAEFVLPYELVRTAPDPDALLLEFLQTTYEAAAITAGGTGRHSNGRDAGP